MRLMQKMKADLFAILAELQSGHLSGNLRLIKKSQLSLLFEYLSENIDEIYWESIQKILSEGTSTPFCVNDEVYCIYETTVNNDYYCDSVMYCLFDDKPCKVCDYRIHANGTVEYLIGNTWFSNACVFATYDEAVQAIFESRKDA